MLCVEFVEVVFFDVVGFGLVCVLVVGEDV